MIRRIVVRTVVAVTALLGRSAFAAGDTIYMSPLVPFADSTTIARNVIDECSLPERQAHWIVEAAKKKGLMVVLDDAAAKAQKGKVLEVQIRNAVSSGNAFVGHGKQVSLQGRLFDDGREIGSFTAVRSSSGGFWGGFQGSCAVLGRCLKTLGEDISEWLQAPKLNARIGG